MPKISQDLAETRKNKILQHAFDVFAEKGYSLTTIDDIVRASGISKGGIYTYFSSKEEMFLAIAESRFKLRHSLIKGFSEDMTNEEKLTRYIHWTLESLSEDRTKKMARFIFEFWSILARNPHMVTKAKERYQLFYDDLAAIIKKGIEVGEFEEETNIDSMVYIILSTMDGIGFVNCIMGMEITHEVIENYTDMILRKIRKEELK